MVLELLSQFLTPNLSWKEAREKELAFLLIKSTNLRKVYDLLTIVSLDVIPPHRSQLAPKLPDVEDLPPALLAAGSLFDPVGGPFDLGGGLFDLNSEDVHADCGHQGGVGVKVSVP